MSQKHLGDGDHQSRRIGFEEMLFAHGLGDAGILRLVGKKGVFRHGLRLLL